MKLDREKLAIFWRLHRIPLLTILVFAVLAILLFCVELPQTMPIRNPPDEITVYYYGEETAFTPEEEAYRELYKELRACSHSKLFHGITGSQTWPSMRPEHPELKKYCAEGLVVKAYYAGEQNLPFEGFDNRYHDLYFVLDYPGEDGYPAHEILYHEAGTDRVLSMTNIPSMKGIQECVGRLFEA